MNVMTMLKNKLYPPAEEIRNILMRKEIIKKISLYCPKSR